MGSDRNTDERDCSDDFQHVRNSAIPSLLRNCPQGALVRGCANHSSSSTEFYDIMDMLDKRLNDKGKNWRHVLKALKVLDYCLHEGSELVVTWARQSIYIIKTLREFQYIDEDGRDVGQNGMSPQKLKPCITVC